MIYYEMICKQASKRASERASKRANKQAAMQEQEQQQQHDIWSAHLQPSYAADDDKYLRVTRMFAGQEDK